MGNVNRLSRYRTIINFLDTSTQKCIYSSCNRIVYKNKLCFYHYKLYKTTIHNKVIK